MLCALRIGYDKFPVLVHMYELLSWGENAAAFETLVLYQCIFHHGCRGARRVGAFQTIQGGTFAVWTSEKSTRHVGDLGYCAVHAVVGLCRE